MNKYLLIVCNLLLFSFVTQAQTVHQWYQDGIIVFQLKTNARYTIPTQNQFFSIQEVEFLKDFQVEYGIYEGFQFFPKHEDELLRKTFQIKISALTKVDELIKKITLLPFIEYAEKKELHTKFLTPNDLGANATNGTGMWHLYKMQAEQAWDLSTGSANVIVAITDDAIKTDHPDLINKVIAGNDATDQNSTDPRPCGGNDGNHGTHVSGTVGADTDNGIGVSSIGWNVSIMPVKIGRCSDGALTGGYEGLAWAANNGADVINMSWGGGGTSTFAQNVINAATNQGAILVAAAGNDGTNQQFYPAAYNNVISVASTTISDAKSSFSQYGNWIDIAAPGSAIRSTWANNGYSRIQGTSMASPNVAGLLGLLKSYAPNATNADLIQCLYSSADPVTSFIGNMGAGRINAFAAMQCAANFSFDTDAGISEILQPNGSVCGGSFTPQIELRNFGTNPITSVAITWEWNGTQNLLNWTGNLTTGQTDLITLPIQSSTGGNYTFTATASLVGDQNLTNNTATENFVVDQTGQEIELNLITDCYGSEITWNIKDSNNNTLLSGGPYTNVTGGQTIINTYCLPVGCYTFNIDDSYGDGMNGSQWGGCSVDGDYFGETLTGIPLFEMSAADADFGNGTSHSFCLTAVGVANDASISQIISPNGTFCATQISPQVRIQNYGSNNLTSAVINYDAGGINQIFNWTGNLSTGQSQVVTLPSISAAPGNIVFVAATSLPNGQTDDNSLNDMLQGNANVYSSGVNLPFTESFESNSFNTNLWTRINPDNDITWAIETTAGNTPGNKSASMNFFNYSQTSQRDGLVSPLLNLNGYTAVNLDFDHAYRRFIVQGSNQPAPTDSLIISVSSDCGASWQRVFEAGEDGTGSMATNVSSNQAFTPQLAEDWCLQQVSIGGNLIGANCFNVNLDAFIGNQIFVRFEGFNAGTQGNNLYLDNINITGVGVPFQYDAGISNNFSQNTICGASVEPLVEIRNFGTANLTSATVQYQLNGGATQVFNWTGNLAPNQAENITLAMQNLQTGNNIFAVNTVLPSGVTDQNISNDAQTFVIAASPLVTPSLSIAPQFCVNTNETISATPSSGGNILWFDDLQTTTPIATTNNLNFNLPVGNYDFYVQEVIDSSVQNVGPSSFNSGAFFQSTARFLYFDVFEDVRLKSVLVNADVAGNRTIEWRDSNGAILGQTMVNIPAGISRVSLNFNLTPGTNYQLGLGAGINGLWRTNDAANIQFPYDINGLISIVESDVGVDFNPPQPNTFYYSFYDWELERAYCESAKTLVNIDVESCDVPPNADFEASKRNICVGESVTFTDLSTESPSNWSWTFAGGSPSSSSLQNPTVTYNTVGTFAVSLTATNNFSNNTETKTAYIVVGDFPTVNISGQNTFCTGGTTLLTANTSGANINFYQWKRNGVNTGVNSSSFLVTQVGNYTLEVTAVNGCKATSPSISVSEVAPLSVVLTVINSSSNTGNASISAQVSGGTPPFDFDWNNGAFSGFNIQNLATGTYFVNVSDVNACSVLSDTIAIGTVSVNELELAELIQVYPNPTTSLVNISGKQIAGKKLEIEVYNMMGQIILQDEIVHSGGVNTTINLGDKVAGVYQILIKTETQQLLWRVVKND